MSTRASICIKDKFTKLWFYRHSDGYPDGTLPTLEKFLSWVIEGKIRDNTEQAAGWLIMIGNTEYEQPNEPNTKGYSGWKVGSYEPAKGKMGGIEYLYTIDLDKKTIKWKEVV